MPVSQFRAAALLLFSAALALPVAAQQSDYRMGSKDLLEIKVLEIPDLNVERRVSDSGNVDLPLLGAFPVQGLTAEEVKLRLETVLREKYVNRANVSIVIREYANKPVSILGAVQKPGSLNISGKWDLLQAISAAGGLTPGAGKKIFVLRRSENGLSDRLEVSSDDLFRRSSPIWNVPIYPSDIVNIPTKSSVTVFCLGEVKTPGALDLDSDDRLTLLAVIAKAGGLTDRASKGGVRVKRKTVDGRDQELRFDYGRIVSGKDEDPILKPDDVIIIKESFF